jgi:hypothetical protein
LDEGKRYPERFDRRVIGICMGNNEVSDGVWLGRVEDINYRLIIAEVAEKRESDVGGEDQ